MDEPMAAAGEDRGLLPRIIARFNAALSKDDDRALAIEDVVAWLQSEHLEVEFFAEFGEECVSDLLRERVHRTHVALMRPLDDDDEPGERRADVRTLEDVFQTKYSVGGKMKMAGQMVREDWLWLARDREKDARNLNALAKKFHKVGLLVKPGKKTSDCLDAAKFKKIMSGDDA